MPEKWAEAGRVKGSETEIDSTDMLKCATVADEGNLAEATYSRILDWMLSGDLKAGQAMQERRLADALNVSRTPVREALGRLEAEQLLMRRRRVLLVAELSVETYVHLLDMRRILETEVAARATGHLSAAVAARVEDAISDLLAQEAPTPAAHWAVDDLVHNSIAEAAGNPTITQTIRDLRRRTHIFNTQRIAYRRRPGADEHRALIHAVRGADPALSRRLMGEHLDHVRDAIIDYILGHRT
ncbi:GntR family transcriptional regulator [Roseisalinus antarcticus]|uniref:HTH-type transcriptional regulator LutR n=1 Tax=Roseisalinus antarcticus TaxID=254357 RepID=A0A1Y5T5Q2_9RHOB|nr:GntR family transcriptional regulator [Roseisalinus antarcticus]SLN56492.1 HTH-type transcriptional regulator LutR [Roseisalinus antarcticus]